jgi:hypothetical protein
MPFGAIKISQRSDLFKRFLKVALTKGTLPGREGFPKIFGLSGFTDGEQVHSPRLAACLQCCFLYASGYAPDVVCYAAHSVKLPRSVCRLYGDTLPAGHWNAK